MTANNPGQESRNEGNMSLFEHLNELRVRLTRTAYSVLIASFFCWFFKDEIFDFLRLPIAQYLPKGGLVFTAPMDKFMAYIKVTLTCGIFLSTPYWLSQLWGFIAPALYKRERKMAAGFVVSGTILFLAGLAFSYYLVLPLAFKFLLNFGGTTDTPMITIDNYLGFLTQTAIAFGVCFQMPVVISFLGMIGVVSQRFLREKRKFAWMVIALISAIVTPPDALSMILLLVPLCALYEISILIVGSFEKTRMDNANKS